jgi:hypothetical protein
MPQFYAAIVHANRGKRRAAAIIERLQNRDRFNSGERL